MACGGGGVSLGGASFSSIGDSIGGAPGHLANLQGAITGANATADAYQNAANAQLAQQRADREQALKFAAPSAAELAQLQQSITLNNQDISRKQKLLASADPAMIEAGKQALKLMQGKNASAIAPYQNQRAQQRAQLEQGLSQRLGGDYATSSAGIQALNNFDQQTANGLQAVQQQTLGQFMGYVGGSEQFGNTQANIGNKENIAAAYGNIGSRQANAISGNRIDAQLGYMGDLMRTTSQQQFLSSMYQNNMPSAGGGNAEQVQGGNVKTLTGAAGGLLGMAGGV